MFKFEKKDDATFSGEIGMPVPLEIKLADDAETSGVFEGYAATFGNADRGFDVIEKGAFLDSLRDRPANRVKLLYQHDPHQVLGSFQAMSEDDRGLYVKGRLNMKVARAVEVHSLMAEGALDSMSIGYRTVKDEIDREAGVRRLITLLLMEVSIVTFPMNEKATINRVKAGVMPTERQFEQFLMREAGFSAQDAKAIIANGYKSISAKRDAGGGGQGDILAALAEVSRLTQA